MFRKFLFSLILLSTLGVQAAENWQSWNGVAQANIQTWSGVAIANVGSWNGVDNTGAGGPTLVVDLDFSTKTGSDGDFISTLTATVGKDLTATLLERPTLETAERNGLNIGRFNGTANTMGTVDLDTPVTMPCVVLTVHKLNTAGVVNQRFLSSNAEDSGNRIIIRFDSAPQYQGYAGSAFVNTWANTDPDTSWHVLATCYNGDSTLTVLDTGTAETSASGMGTTGRLLGIRVSGDYDGTINPTSVDVGQIRIWQGAMDATALAAEISTMRTKWGF